MTTLEQKLMALPPARRQRLLQFSYAPDATRVLTDEPEICGECGELRHLFTSRGGSSRCWRCDMENEDRRAAADRRRLEIPALRP